MKIEQVYSFVNEIFNQSTGGKAIAQADATDLVSIGNEVLSSTANTENFFGCMVDRIAKTLISVKPYSSKGRALLMDTFEFGAVLQKIYVDPMEAKTAAHWNIEDGALDPVYVIKPTISQKLFSGLDTFECDTAIPDSQAKSAFTSAEQMAVLIDGIYTTLSNSMEMYIDALAETAYGVAIANRLVYAKDPKNVRGGAAGNNLVVDLRSEYNTYYGLSDGDTGYLADAAAANRSPEFLRFAAKVIKDYTKRFEIMSVLFNQPSVSSTGAQKKYYRHTPASSQRLTLIDDFVSAFNSDLQSEVFNTEFTALPNYSTVPYWQASGLAWGNTRKVMLDVDCAYTADGSTRQFRVAQDGVVGILMDVDALGMTINNERIKSVYDPRHEVTAVYSKADKGYFFDPSENCIIFVVADSIASVTDITA